MEKIRDNIEKNGERIGLTVWEAQALAKIVGELCLGTFCNNIQNAEDVKLIMEHFSWLIADWNTAV